MRHYFSPPPVATHAGGMGAPPGRARLIARSRVQQRLTARLRSTTAAAVDLPPIAATADDHLATAAGTQEQSAQSRLGLRPIADETWTNATIGRTVGLHSCPARCAARRRCRTSRLSSPPCLPSSLAGSGRAVLHRTRHRRPALPQSPNRRCPSVTQQAEWSPHRPASATGSAPSTRHDHRNDRWSNRRICLGRHCRACRRC
jgi:hypothetical protein